MRKADVYKMIATTGTIQQINSFLASGETPDSLDEDNRRLIDHILDNKNMDLFMKLENVLWSRNSDNVRFGSHEIDGKRYIKLLELGDGEFIVYIFNLSNEDLVSIRNEKIVSKAVSSLYNQNKNIMRENITRNSEKLRILLKYGSNELKESIVRNKENVEFSQLYALLDEGVIVEAKESVTLKTLTDNHKTLLWLEKSGYKDFKELSVNGQIKVLEHLKSLEIRSDGFLQPTSFKNAFYPAFEWDDKFRATPKHLKDEFINNQRQKLINNVLNLGRSELVKPLFDIMAKDEEIIINTDLPIQILEEVAKFEDSKFITYTDFAKSVELKLKNVDKNLAPLLKRLIKLEAQNRELKRNMEKYVKAWDSANWDDD